MAEIFIASPVGNLRLIFSERGLREIQRSQEEVTPEGEWSCPHQRAIVQWFQAYRDGMPSPVPWKHLDSSVLSPFQREVFQALSLTPFGRWTHYGDLALSVGRPKGAQAIGQALHHNPFPVLLPCHRVIPKTKTIGGFAWGPEAKRSLLSHEGSLFLIES